MAGDRERFLAEGFDDDVTKPILDIGASTLLTGGAHSTRFFGNVLDDLAPCLPRAERIVIPDAAHNVPGDKPAPFRDAVRAFLVRQQQAANLLR